MFILLSSVVFRSSLRNEKLEIILLMLVLVTGTFPLRSICIDVH